MDKRFDEIFLLYNKDIFRCSISYVINKHDAEDIVQKTFYKLYTNKKILNKENEIIKKWLYRVCINESKDLLKSSWKKVSTNDDLLINKSNTKKKEVDLIDSLKLITPIYRSTLYLYYYEGYSIKEISRIINKSESAVKMRLQRGKEELKKEMEV